MTQLPCYAALGHFQQLPLSLQRGFVPDRWEHGAMEWVSHGLLKEIHTRTGDARDQDY